MNNNKSGDFTFLCSNCDAPLAEFLEKPASVSEPTVEAKKIRALCPHCGDASFTKEIFSNFYLGATEYTAIESLDEEDGIIIIQTIKAKKHE